jgi:hypothetical protein
MTENQEQKIKSLLEKYNDVLLVSMKLAVTEDFVNLLIVNGDDSDFELKDLIQEKGAFSTYVMKEFMKQNSSNIVSKLKHMEEPKIEFNK